MDDNRMLYSQRNIRLGDKTEVPYAHWPFWGQPVLVSINAQEIQAERHDISYNAWIRCCIDKDAGNRIVDPTSPEQFTNGDSHVNIGSENRFAFPISETNTASYFELIPNSEGRLSHLIIQNYPALSIHNALSIAKVGVNNLSFTLTASTKVPLFWDAILIKSSDNLEIRMEHLSPYPRLPLIDLDPTFRQPSLLPFVQIFAEGLRSSSPFYRFLCFFKITERLNSSVRSKLRKICMKHSVEPPMLNGVLSDDLIGSIDSKLIGKKFTAVIINYQDLYRNSIAHLILEDKILPFDLTTESKVRSASMVLGVIVDELLQQMADSVKKLREQGVGDDEISFG